MSVLCRATCWFVSSSCESVFCSGVSFAVVVWILVMLRISADGGLLGRFIVGRLFSLNALLSSSLYFPGWTELIRCACIMHDMILVMVSLSNISEAWGWGAVLLVLLVTVLYLLFELVLLWFLFSSMIFFLNGHLFASVRWSSLQLMHFLFGDVHSFHV